MKYLKDLLRFFLGKKEYSFFFQSMTFGDSLLTLFLLLSKIFGLDFYKGSHSKFLNELKRKFKFKKAFLFGSARSSLYSLLKSLNYSKGSEVLLTGFTCEAVPNAIINAGYIPIYVDIKKSNYCMDPRNIEKLITPKTKVIIIQHTFGIPAEIEEIIKISKKHNLFTIEDCALSLGSKYKNRLTGTFCDASIFTFELSKTITSCWGGMLFLNSNKDNVINLTIDFYNKVPSQTNIQKIKILFQLGVSGLLYNPRIYIIGKYILSILFKLNIFSPSTSSIEKKGQLPSGYLHRLSNEQVIILYRQFLRLDFYINKKEKLKKKYIGFFKNFLDKEFINATFKNGVVLIRFPILTKNRSDIKAFFKMENMELQTWFTAPISSKSINHELFKYYSGSCPNSEYVSERIINLPIIDEYNQTVIVKRDYLKSLLNFR